jgi:hypothetical protein
MVRVLLVLRLFWAGVGQYRVAWVYNSMASMANLASFQSRVKFFWVSKICDGSVLGLQVLRVWQDINLWLYWPSSGLSSFPDMGF